MPFRRGQLADVAKGSLNLAASFGSDLPLGKTLSTASLEEPSAVLDMTTVYSRPPSSAAVSLASPSGTLAWTLQGERGSMYGSPTMARRHRSCGFSVFDDQHICKDRFIVIRKGLGMLADPNKMAVYCDLRLIPKHLTLNRKAYLVALDVDRLRQLGRGAGLSPIEASRSWIARECFCCRIMVPLRLPQSDVEITLDEADPGGTKHILLQVVLLSDPTDRREWCAVGDVVVVQRHSSVSAGLRAAIVDRSAPSLRKALETLTRHEKEVAEYQQDLKRLKAEAQDALQSLGGQKPDLQEEQRKELSSVKLKEEWSFLFMSREEFLELEEQKGGVPRCQELQAKGKLKEHIISLREALKGSYAADMAVFSHRWFDSGHPDKRNVKLAKAKEFLRQHPCIRWVWCDWLCLPQGSDRTPKEKTYFDDTLQNVMMLYLGLVVVIFFEAQYFGRFWPLLECWAAFQQPSLDGLTPNIVPGLSRAKFCCVCVAEGKDTQFYSLMKDLWGCLTADEVREKLMQPEILVGDPRDKDIQVRVLRALNKQVASAFSDLCKDCDRGFALRTASLDTRVMDYLPRRLQSDHNVLNAWSTGTLPPRAKSVCSCSFHNTTEADSALTVYKGMPVRARRHTNLGTPSLKFYAGTIVNKEADGAFAVQYEDGDQDLSVPQAWLLPQVDQQSLTLSLVRHLSERPAAVDVGVDPPPKPPPRVSHVGTDAPLQPLVVELGTQAHPLTSHAGIDAPLRPAVSDVGTDAPLQPKARNVGIDAPLQPLLKHVGTDPVEGLEALLRPAAIEPPPPPPEVEPVPPQLSMSTQEMKRSLDLDEKPEGKGCCTACCCC